MSDGALVATDTVVVSTTNSAPVAHPGSDQTGQVGEQVFLDGSGSTDLDGDALTFSWSFTSRPAESASTLSNSQAAQPAFTIDQAGEYVIQLTVEDGRGAADADTVRVSTTNSAPVADAGFDQSGVVGSVIQLDGGGSFDVDADPLDFSWSITAAPPGSSAALDNPAISNPSMTLDTFGDYVIQLIVDDGTEESIPDTLVASTLNTAPVALPGPDAQASTNEDIVLNGTQSFDAEGDQLTFAWSIVSQPPDSAIQLNDATAINPTFAAAEPGSYIFQLVVDDGFLSSSPATAEVTVTGPPPDDMGCAANGIVGILPITRIGDGLILALLVGALIGRRRRRSGVPD